MLHDGSLTTARGKKAPDDLGGVGTAGLHLAEGLCDAFHNDVIVTSVDAATEPKELELNRVVRFQFCHVCALRMHVHMSIHIFVHVSLLMSLQILYNSLDPCL